MREIRSAAILSLYSVTTLRHIVLSPSTCHRRPGRPSLAGCARRSASTQFLAITTGGVGLPILQNSAVHIASPDRRFWLAGLDDQIAHRLGPNRFRGEDDLPGTLARITTDDPVILLAHEPDIFVEVPARVALTIAGHTHDAGQRLVDRTGSKLICVKGCKKRVFSSILTQMFESKVLSEPGAERPPAIERCQANHLRNRGKQGTP